MGILYLVLPLTEQTAQWLDAEQVKHPALSTTFRSPTPAEIVATVAELGGYVYQVNVDKVNCHWQMQIEWAADPVNGPNAKINVREYSGDDHPHDFTFRKGTLELNLRLVERLTHRCGPLVITDDSCCVPYLVQPGMTVTTMVDQYAAR